MDRQLKKVDEKDFVKNFVQYREDFFALDIRRSDGVSAGYYYPEALHAKTDLLGGGGLAGGIVGTGINPSDQKHYGATRPGALASTKKEEAKKEEVKLITGCFRCKKAIKGIFSVPDEKTGEMLDISLCAECGVGYKLKSKL